MSKVKTYDAQTIGRRKTSVARAYVLKGEGKIFINRREFKEYFPKATSQYVVKQPLDLLNCADRYDFKVNVKGGGITGQAGAVRLAIARALIRINPEERPKLKAAGFLTRDPREVESKKYGRSGARRSFQFSKR